jgi:hypothetical protein
MKKVVICLALAGALVLSGCATAAQQAADLCLPEAQRLDPDEEPTTQGHDRSQALVADCMKRHGFEFDWNNRPCDRAFPATVGKGRCYARASPSV